MTSSARGTLLAVFVVVGFIIALVTISVSLEGRSNIEEKRRDAACSMARAEQRELLRQAADSGEPLDITRALVQPEVCGP